MIPKEILIDACVVIDMYLSNRERHQEAKELHLFIRRNDIQVSMPYHCMFEVSSALKNIKSSEKEKYEFDTDLEGEHNRLALNPIAIDEVFINKYLDLDLPYCKANDLIYLSIAVKDNIPFITEDSKLYSKAKEAGASVFRIRDFLDKYK